MNNNHDFGTIPTFHTVGFKVFAIVVYVLSAAVSLLMFLYGLLLIKLQPSIWNNKISRVIIVAQILNCMRFVIRIIASFVLVHVDFGCRALIFLNNALALLPVNLCIYCVLYLQLVVIHRVSPQKRWPPILLMSVGMGISIIPTLAFFYTPPSNIGIENYCKIPRIMGKRYYVFLVLTISIWQYLSGIVGLVSVVIIGRHILRTRKDSRRVLAVSMHSYCPSYDVVEQSRSKMLHRTLLTIIWYPITPILSLWLNTIIFSISYYKRRSYAGLEFVNVVLLGMQSLLLGIALLVNPTILDGFRRQIRGRFKSPEQKVLSQPEWQSISNFVHELPPLTSTSTGLSDGLSDNVSDF